MAGSGAAPTWAKEEMTRLAQEMHRWRTEAERYQRLAGQAADTIDTLALLAGRWEAAARAAEAYIVGAHEGDCHRREPPRKLCYGCDELYADWQRFKEEAEGPAVGMGATDAGT